LAQTQVNDGVQEICGQMFLLSFSSKSFNSMATMVKMYFERNVSFRHDFLGREKARRYA
jgi:hypothetical protein